MTNKRHNLTKSNQPGPLDNGGVYEIKIKGILDDHWKQWFEGMTLDHVTNGETGQGCTLITGPIADQPALHGLLAKIRDLNLALISVRKIAPASSDNQKRDQNGEQKNSPHQ